MSTYFIADTHFGDEKIMRYENRPFESANQMDEQLIENWNSLIKSEDTVYHLGDFSSYDINKNAEILSRLNGRKILVMGNHDRHITAKQWRESGFDECYELPVVYEGYFILSHEPMYVNVNMPYANVFGHVHGTKAYKDFSSQSYCVSVERTDFTPVIFDIIKQKVSE